MGLSRRQQFELEFERPFARNHAESIISQSPPILAEKIEFIRAFFEKHRRLTIVGRYQVAVTIREIYDDVNENNGAVYGAKAVQVIKDFFGWDDGTIYHAMRVADAFTPEQIQDIADKQTPRGRPLSYSHVVALAYVEDDSKRENLLKKAVSEEWSSVKLSNAAGLSRTPNRDKQEDGRGRPLARPKSFDAVLDQQASFVNLSRTFSAATPKFGRTRSTRSLARRRTSTLPTSRRSAPIG